MSPLRQFTTSPNHHFPTSQIAESRQGRDGGADPGCAHFRKRRRLVTAHFLHPNDPGITRVRTLARVTNGRLANVGVACPKGSQRVPRQERPSHRAHQTPPDERPVVRCECTHDTRTTSQGDNFARCALSKSKCAYVSVAECQPYRPVPDLRSASSRHNVYIRHSAQGAAMSRRRAGCEVGFRRTGHSEPSALSLLDPR